MINNAHKDTLFGIPADLLVCLFLGLITLAVYWQVTNHEFVNYDDPAYITNNRHIQNALTLESISWAFTATHECTWQPLIWLSYILDYQVHGLNPSRYHLTNLLFHTANSLLLFLILRRMTYALWQSAFVAALFALHPLNVESVAWVAERKDVLSTFFWMLTMWGYVRYVERPGSNRYLLFVLFFILGLMSKPMVVTLPFVLLLLDYWPLKRFQFGQSGGGRLVLEKLPLLALSAASSVVTYFVQHSGGAVTPLSVHPFTVRIANALVSYIAYMGKMIWPFHLAVLYPYSRTFSCWQVAGACLLLVTVSLLVILAVKRRPYLAVGWLWYIGTLVPVIGLVQVGLHAMADRFTYVPLIGLFIMIAWRVPELVSQWRRKKTWLALIAATLLSILAAATLLQVRYWTNSVTLFEHALHVNTNNSLAHSNLGTALAKRGRITEAIRSFSKALRINPGDSKAHNNLGLAFEKQGRMTEAVIHFSQALRINPEDSEAHNNLGRVLVNQSRVTDAIRHFSHALRINPEDAKAHNNLGVALMRKGKIGNAIAHFQEALKIRPDLANANNNLKMALTLQGKK